MVSGKDPKNGFVVRGKKALFLFLTFLPLTTYNLPLIYAADANVTASARVLRDRVRIGDEVRLLLLVEHPRKYTVTAPGQKMNLSPFEVKRVEAEPFRTGQNRIRETYRMTLTVFQTGDLTVPPITVQFTNENGEPGSALTEPVSVKVMSVGKKLTDKDDIRPIKPPVSTGLRLFWSMLGAILAGLLFIVLISKIVLRKIMERKDAESRKPAHERVKIELHRLKDHGYLEEKNYKAFYSELSNILRRYLERRFHVEALERTSSELLDELKKLSLEKEVLDEVRDVLTESDLIKFAKFAPSYELAGRLEALLLDVAENTKVDPERRVKRGVEG